MFHLFKDLDNDINKLSGLLAVLKAWPPIKFEHTLQVGFFSFLVFNKVKTIYSYKMHSLDRNTAQWSRFNRVLTDKFNFKFQSTWHVHYISILHFPKDKRGLDTVDNCVLCVMRIKWVIQSSDLPDLIFFCFVENGLAFHERIHLGCT